MNYQEMKYIYQPAANPTGYTLLLLHGTGGNEADLLPIGRQFGDGVNILSLRGNVSEHGMPRFFKRIGMGIFDEDDLRFRTNELLHNITTISGKESFDAGKLIALGYSNGANIAGSALLMYPDFFAGAILFRPMQPFVSPEPFAAIGRTPILMTNGAVDPTIDPAATQRYVQLLENAGFDVAAYSLPSGHGLTQEDLHLAQQWFHEHFSIAPVE
ncbi:MAG: alpha/beta hydrolase [Sphingobacteriales bacterium]|nr:alpha/beta hydrolase [Sphingobacteriales bacterium]